ncbi:MAG: PAS domain S-box protein [Acidobacteria bacterium]|nr:PAS domain S-box protein [Acidobacteriota bacterium]
MRETEERYARNIAKTAPDIIRRLMPTAAIEFVNSAVETVFGYTPAEVLGQQLSMLIPDYLSHIFGEGRIRRTRD